MREGDDILIDDGEIDLQVLEVKTDHLSVE